jgi:6-phosphofructokinase 1
MKKIKTIGLLTSGGDAPGMNAAIRAVVRTATYNKLKVMGFLRGYRGLMHDGTERLTAESVGGIINLGGTIIKTARWEPFKKREGQKQAVQVLKKHKVDGLIIIGGDGSFRGAHILSKEWGIPTIGIPGTIDNDLYGSDYTIGFDTAVSTAVEAIDKLRDTATSHDRLFLVEVMGRTSGFIALYVGLACGAEEILIPEERTNVEKVKQMLATARARGKKSSIVIVAEGDDAGNVFELKDKLHQSKEYDVRVAVLGHIQRGGMPNARDRILAGRLGYEAVIALMKGRTDIMVGIVSGNSTCTSLEKAYGLKKPLDMQAMDIGHILAT